MGGTRGPGPHIPAVLPTLGAGFQQHTRCNMRLLLAAALLTGAVYMLGCAGGDKPADQTATTEQAAPAAGPKYPVDLANGQKIYDKYCFACHKDGVSGAAKFTDTVRWQAQADKGMTTLLKHATEGFTGTFGSLPPKGTCMECQEKDLHDAIHYMMSQAGVQPKY